MDYRKLFLVLVGGATARGDEATAAQVVDPDGRTGAPGTWSNSDSGTEEAPGIGGVPVW
ncbi:hypothetical protein [Pyxidicoccus xibeiensis]|uniref:hypothetical protein n=1 Tax=Pyxidicoccus xibeiensis TaxID=2906759 RepID=UPI0020A76369|nr:hypothetical protein [Pyxidicoccus xibeiensis]MCP3144488.1 hypothetical protein [Pyxidicoccus xibeiensis]